jgi:hypothetical protein
VERASAVEGGSSPVAGGGIPARPIAGEREREGRAAPGRRLHADASMGSPGVSSLLRHVDPRFGVYPGAPFTAIGSIKVEF